MEIDEKTAQPPRKTVVECWRKFALARLAPEKPRDGSALVDVRSMSDITHLTCILDYADQHTFTLLQSGRWTAAQIQYYTIYAHGSKERIINLNNFCKITENSCKSFHRMILCAWKQTEMRVNLRSYGKNTVENSQNHVYGRGYAIASPIPLPERPIT